MRRLARFLLLVPFALLIAIATGSFFLMVACVLDPLLAGFTGDALAVAWWTLTDRLLGGEDPAPFVADAVLGAGRLAASLLVVPPVLVALVSEVIGARSLLWHAGATGLLTGAMPFILRGGGRGATPEEIHIAAVLALTGAVAGLVYWLIAGSSAGSGARPEPAAARRRDPAPTARSPGS
jgi:hypothetical protein